MPITTLATPVVSIISAGAKGVWQRLGYGHYIGNAHLNIASYFVEINEIDSAEFHLGKALALATDHKLPVLRPPFKSFK